MLEELEDPKVESEERFIMKVTEAILLEMEAQGVTKERLAERLGISKTLVTRMLNGTSEMTLREFADICYELGVFPGFYLEKRG